MSPAGLCVCRVDINPEEDLPLVLDPARAKFLVEVQKGPSNFRGIANQKAKF